MSETLRRIQTLVLGGDFLVSDHGFDELAEDGILAGDVIEGIATAVAIEDFQTGFVAAVSWPYSVTQMATLSMSCGRSPQASVGPRCL